MAVTTTTMGGVSNVGSSTVATPSYPTVAAGCVFHCFVGWGEQNGTPPTLPTGWTFLYRQSSAPVSPNNAWGVDTGPRHVDVYERDALATGSEGGTTINVTPGGPAAADRVHSAIIVGTPKTLGSFRVGALGANQNSPATPYVASVANANFGFTLSTECILVAFTVYNPDNAAQTASTLTWTGSGTVSTMSALSAGANTNGNDLRWVARFEPLTSTGTGTLSISTPTSSVNVWGPTVFLLIGDIDSAPTTTLSPSGVATAESLPTPSISSSVISAPTALGSSESFGVLALSSLVTCTPSGFKDPDQWGNPTASGLITSSPSAVSSAEVHGSPSLSSLVSTSPQGLASLAAFGAPSLLASLSIAAQSIASAESMGSPSVSVGLVLAPQAISSGETFGLLAASTIVTSSPAGVASSLVVGVVTVTPGGVTLMAVGISSEVALGNPQVSGQNPAVVPQGIVPALVWGTAAIISEVVLTPEGAATSEQSGTPQVTPSVAVQVVGISSGVLMGSPSARLLWNLIPVSIVSLESFGQPLLTLLTPLYPDIVFGAKLLGASSSANVGGRGSSARVGGRQSSALMGHPLQ